MTEQAVAYVRVSTAEQASDERTSLAIQRERCAAYCTAQGWDLVEVYEDAGVSGASDAEDRPALSRLLEDAAEGKFKHVIVFKVDRMARSLRRLLNLSHHLDELGVGLASVAEQFDTSTASGTLYFSLLGAFAEFERAQINERMTEGRRAVVRNGDKYLCSLPPYGYRRANGHLEVDEEQAAVVRRIFHLAAYEDMGLRAIAKVLMKEGVGPLHNSRKGLSSKWGIHATAIGKILRAERYCGRGEYAGIEQHCPAIVDEETFRLAREAVGRHKVDSLRNTKAFYLLQHLIWCRTCGGRYLAKTVNGGQQVYLCRQRNAYGKDAGHVGVKWRWKAPELELPIKRHVMKLLVDPTYLSRELEVRVEEAKRATRQQEEQRARVRARLTALDEEEQRVLMLARRGVYADEGQLIRQLEAVREERREQQAELEELQQSSDTAHALEYHLAVIQEGLALTDLAREMKELIPDADWQNDSWIDDSLALLAEQPGDSIDKAFADLIKQVVTRVWVEPDGSLTIEGVFGPVVSASRPIR